MVSGEEALVIFTILAQLAVGIWLVAVILRTSIAKKAGKELAAKLTGPAILLVGPIIAVALLISLFHLGTPLLAYGSIANLGTSWLSREIIFSGLFLFLWIAAYLNYRKANASNLLAWVTSIIGLIAIFSMASIYHATIFPAWSTVNTYIAFFATTLVLGSVGAATLVGFAAKSSTLNQSVVKLLWQISFFAVVAVIIQLVFVVTNIMGLSGGTLPEQSTAMLLKSAYSLPLILHGILMLVGALVLAASMYKLSKGQSIGLPLPVFYSTFILILVGELVGRYLFYASAVPIGIS